MLAKGKKTDQENQIPPVLLYCNYVSSQTNDFTHRKRQNKKEQS